MYRTTIRFGRSGSALAGISALDIACWDLHGKSEGKPVYDLIGGRTQTRVPCYVSRLYAMEDLDQLAAEAKHWKDLGFARMKQRFGFGPKDGPHGMRRNVDLVRTVRNAVGENVELAADAYMGWDVGYAIEMAKLLRDFNLSWIEEPLMPHDVAGYVELKQRCPWQRWSCGEHSYGKWDFKDLIERRAVDILQFDTNRVGGITEATQNLCDGGGGGPSCDSALQRGAQHACNFQSRPACLSVGGIFSERRAGHWERVILEVVQWFAGSCEWHPFHGLGPGFGHRNSRRDSCQFVHPLRDAIRGNSSEGGANCTALRHPKCQMMQPADRSLHRSGFLAQLLRSERTNIV